MKNCFVVALCMFCLTNLKAQVTQENIKELKALPGKPGGSRHIPMERSKNGPPLYVIFSLGKIVSISDSLPRKLSPHYIKSLNVTRDSTAVKKYGRSAENGYS